MKFLLFSLLGILLPLVIGSTILFIIYRKRDINFSLIETLIFSLLLGIGFQTIYMFLIGRLGINYSISILIIMGILFTPLLIWIVYIRKKRKLLFYAPTAIVIPSNIYKRIFSTICVIFIGRNIYSSFFIVLNTPTYPDDAFVNRNFRAKVFYYTQRLNYDKPEEPRLFNGGFSVDYPMFNPLFKSYSAFTIGEYDDRWTNVIAPLMNLLVIMMIFGFFTRRYGFFTALISTAAYTLIPQIVIHSFNTYAEICLIGYLIPLVFLLYDYFKLKEKKPELLVLASMLFMFLGWVKNEGLFIFGLGVFLAFVLTKLLGQRIDNNKNISISTINFDKKDIIEVIKFGFPTIIFYAIWKSYLMIYNIRDVIGYGSTAKMREGISIEFQKEALLGMKNIVFSFGGLNIVPLAFILTLALFHKSILKDKSYFFLSLCVLIPFFTMFFFFIFTKLFAQSMTTGDTRQFMVLISVAFIFLAIIFTDYFNKTDNIGLSE